MSRDWVPTRESRLVTFSAHFAQQISASPESYGLTADEASEFAALNDAWVNAYTAANRNATRTPMAIVAKDDARDAMLPMLRQLGMFIQRRPQTTNDQRVRLGLRIHSTNHTPIGPPQTAPALNILSVLGQTVKIDLRDRQNQSRRGKPFGVAGAIIYSRHADDASNDMRNWNTLGNYTRPYVRLTFPSALYPAGSKVWLAACWYNPRGQRGPVGNFASFHLAGGLAADKAA